MSAMEGGADALRRGPKDEVFVTRIADDATFDYGGWPTASRPRACPPAWRICRRPPQGCRLGVGGSNTLTSLARQSARMKRVTNPLAADGGADPRSWRMPEKCACHGAHVLAGRFPLDFEMWPGYGRKLPRHCDLGLTGLQKTIFSDGRRANGDKLSPDGIHQLWTLYCHRIPSCSVDRQFLTVPQSS